jgi:WD40 repeat protein
VTGGTTGYKWEKSDSIYVFDRASGSMVRRITGLPGAVENLACSADGRFVAAALLGKNGISVFRTDDWQEAVRDADYADSSYGLAFDRSGRLAVGSDDGYIRLYTSGFERIAKVKTFRGEHPRSVAFSPDGTRLAVGYPDRNGIDILSARTAIGRT